MWSRILNYFKSNWGAPFIFAFIVLLVASAVLLSDDQTSTANGVAVYSFYALVAGVVLQIASYIKFGEGKSEEEQYIPSWAPARTYRPGRRTLAIVVIVLVIIAALGLTAYYYQSSTSSSTRSSRTTSTTRTIGQLAAGVDFILPQIGPNNSVQLTIGVNETGGVGPYNFTAYWSDGVNQTNDVGVFIRSFLSNESVPNSVKVIVKSSDGQTAMVLVQIPTLNRTTSTTSTKTTSTTTIPSIKFIESGLPPGSLWTLILNGTQYSSNTNQIAFNYTLGGLAKYSISGPYDQKNFKWAFIPSPQSGTINASLSVQINLVFSNQTILTPTGDLFLITKPLATTSISSNSVQLNATYLNTFPDRVQAIVLATARNDNTSSVSVTTASIEPVASGEQTAILIFNGLPPGNYSVSLSVASPSGVQLSTATNSTFTISG